MKFKVVSILTFTMLLVSLFACQATLEQISSIEISFDDFEITHQMTKELEISVGDSFIVSLFSNPTTGFQWPDLGDIADDSIIEQLSHEFEPPESDLPGAAGKDVWTFEALNKGQTTISMEYSQPWEGGIKAEWTFGLTVLVK